jgi:hypothetical protein
MGLMLSKSAAASACLAWSARSVLSSVSIPPAALCAPLDCSALVGNAGGREIGRSVGDNHRCALHNASLAVRPILTAVSRYAGTTPLIKHAVILLTGSTSQIILVQHRERAAAPRRPGRRLCRRGCSTGASVMRTTRHRRGPAARATRAGPQRRRVGVAGSSGRM